MPNKDYPIVEVWWIDAINQSDELSVHDLPSLIPVKTLGRLVQQNEEGVWVAQEVLGATRTDTQVRFRNTTAIPAGMVKKVRRLR